MRCSRQRTREAAERAGGAAAAATAWLLGASTVLAQSPSPSPASVGDPRSAGQGPGLVGDPLFAIAVVVAIGVLALVCTLAYVRVTGGARRG